MTLRSLTKHHGLGNDFLVLFDDERSMSAAELADVAVAICDRRTGVGADGLLVATAAHGHSAKMTLFNADGSVAEMSGNGIRCFAQAVATRHGSFDPQLILTDAGTRQVTMAVTDDPAVITAQVEMGEITTLAPPAAWPALGCHPDRPVAHLSMGNPHSVVGVDDVAVVDLGELGAKVPDVNLEIIEPGPESNAVTMRVHERGAGITAACGTGACAAAYAARSWGLVPSIEPDVVVHMDGGTAHVALTADEPPRAILNGPATFVATIEIELP
jgi:diaminopimelate epimerase